MRNEEKLESKQDRVLVTLVRMSIAQMVGALHCCRCLDSPLIPLLGLSRETLAAVWRYFVWCPSEMLRSALEVQDMMRALLAWLPASFHLLDIRKPGSQGSYSWVLAQGCQPAFGPLDFPLLEKFRFRATDAQEDP